MNDTIIYEFTKLIKQIAHDIDEATDKKIKITNIYRLKQLGNALNIIKKYQKEIKSGDDLKDIKGIGKGIISRVDEIISTGKLSEITTEENNDKNVAISKMTEVYGIGEKTAEDIVTNYGIETVEELKEAYTNGTIKLSKSIAIGLKYYGVYKEHIPRSEMIKMEKYLNKTANEIDKELNVTICGSYRRGKDFSNDIDCMLTHPNIVTMDDLDDEPNYFRLFIEKLREKTFLLDALNSDTIETKFMGFCILNKKSHVRRIDIRYIPKQSYYTALLYFTGSGTFNQNMRRHAKKNGFKLNEYGLYKKKEDDFKLLKIKSEEDIFKKLGLEYVEPTDRNMD